VVLPPQGSCSNGGTSNANWVGKASFSASDLVGKVTTDDLANGSDSSGSQSFSSITDWVNFDNPMRLWGKDGGTFPSADNQKSCVSGTCRIWDLSLKATATVARNTSNDGNNQNGAFTPGLNCPAAVHGNKAIADYHTTPNTFLINPQEIIFDDTGDDDGLCESNEACIYSPNIGAYQGHGDYKAAGTCTFQNGTVTNVQMDAYPTNGR
jgi:hypothetical protein